MLCLLLNDVTSIQFAEIQDVLRWQDQVLIGQDDITLTSNLAVTSSQSSLDQVLTGQDDLNLTSSPVVTSSQPSLDQIAMRPDVTKTPKLRSRINQARQPLDLKVQDLSKDGYSIHKQLVVPEQDIKRHSEPVSQSRLEISRRTLPSMPRAISLLSPAELRSLGYDGSGNRNSTDLGFNFQDHGDSDHSGGIFSLGPGRTGIRQYSRAMSVPKLDLSWISQPFKGSETPVVHPGKSETTFGIFPGGDRVRHGKLTTSHVDLANVGDERYVSLENHRAPKTLPRRLSHIDIKALKDNKPQGESLSGSWQTANVTDSGIARTLRNESLRDGISTSKMSVPNEVLRSKSKRTVRSRRDLAKSLPNLADRESVEIAPERGKELAIETVANSSLSPEEKLNIMANLCEGEHFELSSELKYKLGVGRSDSNKQQQGVGHMTSHMDALVRQFEQNLGRTIKPQASAGPKTSRIPSYVRNKTKFEALHMLHTDSDTPDQTALPKTRKQRLRTRVRPRKLQPDRDTDQTDSEEDDQSDDSAQKDDGKRNGSADGMLSIFKPRKYGIDVEEWVKNHGPQLYDVNSKPDLGEEAGDEDLAINKYIVKLKTVQKER